MLLRVLRHGSLGGREVAAPERLVDAVEDVVIPRVRGELGASLEAADNVVRPPDAVVRGLLVDARLGLLVALRWRRELLQADRGSRDQGSEVLALRQDPPSGRAQ